MSTMSVSIVVPTHNRYTRLRNLLASIREHRNPAFASVIVVDDSTDKQELTGYEDINLQHIKFDSRVFVSKAKNIGWKISQADYVFFIDDDNVLGETTLGPLLNTITSSDSIGAVMPGVLYRSRPSLVWVYATPFRDKRMGLNLVGRNLPRDPSLENRLLRTDALPNASLVRRKALDQVRGLDERLVVSSSLDLCQRLKAKGWHVVSNTASLIYHDVETPGQPGWWAAHGSADPDLVRYNLRDSFLLMRKMYPRASLSRLRFTIESMRFVLPNVLAYVQRGSNRRRLLSSVVLGYVEGLKLAGGASVQ